MTVETTEAPTTEATEPVKNIPALESFTDLPMVEMVVTRAKGLMEQLKAVASKLSSAGNVGELLSEAIKTSDNETVVKNRQLIEKANEKILEWTKEMEAVVKPTLSVPSDEELKALDESYKALVSNVKTFDTVFTGEVKATYPDLNLYDYVGELPKGRRGSTGAKSGQGEGSSRPRVSEVAVSTDNGATFSKVEKDGKSTFSVLTQWLKKETGETVGASDLHEAWFEAYKIKEWNDAPEQSTFNYSLKGKDYFIRVTK